MKKKLLSLALALALCLSLTVPALAVGKAGDSTVSVNGNTITLSKPILYTIPTSAMGKIDMSTMEAVVEDMPYDEDSFGCPAKDYPAKYLWPDVDAVYAVPEGTEVTLPDGILTSVAIELDVTWKNGACYADELDVFLYPGFDSVALDGAGYILGVQVDYTEVPENSTYTPDGSGASASAVDGNKAGVVCFYVPEDSSAANPFGASTTASPSKPAAPTVSAAPKFTDVSADSPYAEAISWAVAQGITNGKTATTFGTKDICTISHILTFLWRANGKPDAKVGEAERDSVLRWANGQGMVVTADMLPSPCTRARAVNFMWMAAGKPQEKASTSFTDVYPDDFTKGIAWAVEQGITQGTSATTFSPDNICTRAQIVTFLYRAFK